MKEESKSKLKYGIIISIIGIIVSLICIILELLIIKNSVIFWVIVLSCNLAILIGNLYEYKKM